jgi:hypothetical protein
MRGAAALLALLALVFPAAAQVDDPTDDHSDQDQRYEERLRRSAARSEEPDPATQAAAYLAAAEKLIRDRHYRAGESPRYRVETDDPRLDTAAATELLEAFRSHFDRFFEGRLDLAPYEKPSRVFLFYSFHDYNQLLGGDWRFSYQRPKGHYRPDIDLLTLHTDPDDGAHTLADALIHEAAHQLVEQRIFHRGARAPVWLAEGLAEYFGHTWRDSAGAFHPAELGGKSAKLFRDAPPDGKSEARMRLSSFRDAVKAIRSERPEARVFTGVIEIDDPAAFYGSNASLHYAASGLLVHWLLVGEDGRHAPAFLRYVQAVAEAGPDASALGQELGLTTTEIESAAGAHVARLEAR